MFPDDDERSQRRRKGEGARAVRDVSLWGTTPTCHCVHKATGPGCRECGVARRDPAVASALDLPPSSAIVLSRPIFIAPPPNTPTVVPYDEIVAVFVSALRFLTSLGLPPSPRNTGSVSTGSVGDSGFSPFLLLAPRRPRLPFSFSFLFAPINAPFVMIIFMIGFNCVAG